MVTSLYSTGSRFLVFLKLSDTSASWVALRFLVPLNTMFSSFSERKALIFCSPSTQRMASTILDFPQPFGPTMPVMPSPKLICTLSPKLLNPFISSRVSCIRQYQILKVGKVKNLFGIFRKKTGTGGQTGVWSFLCVSVFHTEYAEVSQRSQRWMDYYFVS